MILNLNDIQHYLDCLLLEKTSVENKIEIEVTPELLLFDNTDNKIRIGNHAITIMLLSLCCSKDVSLFQPLLFDYYCAWESLNNRRKQTYLHYLHDLIIKLSQCSKQVYGIAGDLKLDLLLYFVIGHEAYHSMFRKDEEFVKSAISETITFLHETYDNRERRFDRRAEKLIDSSLREVYKKPRISEEYACDRYSLMFLNSFILKKQSFDCDSFGMLSQQLLDLVVMAQYELLQKNVVRNGLFSTLRRSIFIRVLHQNIMFRLQCVMDTLLDLDETCKVDLLPYYYHSADLFGKVNADQIHNGFSNLGIINTDEKAVEDAALVKELQDDFNQISDFINSLLLGEDLSRFADTL